MSVDTLLLVDDDASLVEQLKLHFEERGEETGKRFRVLTAHAARTALELAQKHEVALVILDMMLPDRSGLEVMGELKAAVGEAPIIMVTAHHDMGTTIRAMKSGAFDYIHKPFEDLAALDLVLDRALEMRRLSPARAVHPGGLHQQRQARRHRGQLARGAADREGDWQDRLVARERAHPGRERHGQGAHRPRHPQLQPRPARGPFVGINCSAIVDDPARERALRPREGRVHRRGQPTSRAASSSPRTAPSSSTRSAT